VKQEGAGRREAGPSFTRRAAHDSPPVVGVRAGRGAPGRSPPVWF